MGCRVLLALLVLHRAKLLASNQSILALGVAPRWVAGTPVPVFTPGTDAGRVCQKALCKDAYKWSNKVGAGRTDNKRPRLHRCRANQAYTAFHGERGFGKDAEIERFVGFAGRKAHKAFLKG